VALALGGVLTGSVAVAQASHHTATQRALAKCAAIENAVIRLGCFDDLTRALKVDGPKAEITTPGKWRVQTETSKIDDSENVFVIVDSNEKIFNRFGRSEGKATLLIRCMENRTSIYIIWAGVFIGSDSTSVTYRLDRDPAKTASMDISTDRRATGFWSGNRAVSFIRAMFGKTQLLARVTPYGESAITVTFGIGGVREATKPVAAACKWIGS